MALAATVVWEVRTTGDPANSGGFNSAAAGTDRSQQDAPHVIIDGVTITATVNATTTDLDIVGYAVSAADIGNTVRIAGGTMTAGTYQINSIPAAGRWRLDRSGGVAGQTGTGRMGGAGSDPALIAAVHAGGNKTYQRTGTYTVTSATPNIAGGCVSVNAGGNVWEGYEVARGDFGAPPNFVASGINTATLFLANANDVLVYNVDVDGATLVALRGMQCIGRSSFVYCHARRCTNSGIVIGSQGSAAYLCEATGCTTAGAGFLDNGGGQGEFFYGCSSHGNSVPGFTLAAATRVIRCLSYANSGATSDGFLMSTGTDAVSCTAYGNGRDGFRYQGVANSARAVNCLAEGNAGIGFNGIGVNYIQLINCAGFGNTGGNVTLGAAINNYNLNFVTTTSTMFVNAAAGNFALNSTATGGALVRQNGVPGTFPDGTTIGYLDRGAAQTSGDPASGGGGSGEVSIGQGTWIH